MDVVVFSIFNPINRIFNLGQIISVVTVGQAMHKVAEDASIKPVESTNSKKSTIGSLVSLFTNSDIQNIGGTPK